MAWVKDELRTHLGRRRIGQQLRLGLKPSKMSIELPPGHSKQTMVIASIGIATKVAVLLLMIFYEIIDPQACLAWVDLQSNVIHRR